jgi:uncharacterized protein (TIGR00106 family)
MSVLLEFAMSPMDKGESLSQYVARSMDIIDGSGLAYQFTPMGTILEGEWDEVMEVVGKCYKRMSEDCRRVSCGIKIDARKDVDSRLSKKMKKVESILDRELVK